MNRIPINNRISYRVIKVITVTILLMTLFFSTLQVFLDFYNEKKKMEDFAETMLKTVKSSAAHASYSLDKFLAQEIVEGLLENQFIVSGVIKDDIKEILGERYKKIYEDDFTAVYDNFFQRFYRKEIKLFAKAGTEKVYVGTLEIVVDKMRIFKGFINRASYIFIRDLAMSLLLIIILVFIFEKLLSRPFRQLGKFLKEIDYSTKLDTAIFDGFARRNDEFHFILRTIRKAVNKNVDTILYQKELENKKKYALKTLVENISHQWRQPLTVIGLSVDNMGDAVEYGEVISKKDIEKINKEIKYLSESLSFFTFIYSKSDIFNQINFFDFVERTLSLLQLKQKDVKIEYELEISRDLEIMTNEYILQEIFLSLLQNSVESGRKNQISFLKIKIVGFEELKNKKVNIKIIDNAGGFPQGMLENIFESYATTHYRGRSKGLGLYKVKNLIEYHLNSTIMIKNYEDGAMVEIELSEQ